MQIVDSEFRISQSVIKYTPDNTSLMINGKLEINEDILPEAFMGKIEKIYLFGEISCNEDHYEVS